MFSLLRCLIFAVIISKVESNNTVYVRGKLKYAVESVEIICDHKLIEHCHKVPNTEMLYTFRVVKLAPSFSITIIIRALSSQRVLYHLNKLDGCGFLNNPFMGKALGHTYQAIVANKTILKCPIPAKVYFLKNMAKAKIIPLIHPPGRYQVNVRMQMSLSSDPFVMEIIWKYNVMHLK